MMEQRIVQRVHRRKDVHLVMREFFDKPGNVTRVRNQQAHSTDAHAEQETRGQGEDVIQRQRRDDDHVVDFRRDIDHRLIPSVDLQQIGDQVAMQKHRAFRDSCGSARVLEECDVVGRQR